MNRRARDYGDPEGEDLPVYDRPYESFGRQGFAMPTYVPEPELPRGAQRIELGEPALVPPRSQRIDEHLCDEVCARLAHDGRVDASDIDVVVHEGEVFLAGTVADREQRRRAEDVAAHVRGVIDVINRVRVRR